MRALNSIAATMMVVLELPILLFTWIVVASRGTHPILVREGTFSNPHTNHLQFNVGGDHWMDGHIRRLCFDLGPILFDVVMGRYSLAEGYRVMNLVAQNRGRDLPSLSFPEKFRIAALFTLATVILLIAWNGF